MTKSLRSRREAALLGLSFKLLDGAGRGALQEFAPILSVSYPDLSAWQLRTVSHGIRVRDFTSVTSLNCFKRSAVGALPAVWDNIPQEVLQIGLSKGWRKINKRCKNGILTGDYNNGSSSMLTGKVKKAKERNANVEDWRSIDEIRSRI